MELGPVHDAVASRRSAASTTATSGTSSCCAGPTSSASARPGSASTTPRPGSRIPSPDLLVAQALLQTKHIRIGPGGFLLPYHHPAELANRVAMLDHLAQGRLNFGVAASGLPSDWAMFNVDGMSGQQPGDDPRVARHHPALWTATSRSTTRASTGTSRKTGTMFGTLKPHIVPFQKPHPPIGVAGLSKGSDTLKLAGERGFCPMSLNLNPGYVGSHWEAVEEGAAQDRAHAQAAPTGGWCARSSSPTPTRRPWRCPRAA